MSTVPNPADVVTDRWPPVDGCPNCIANVEPPATFTELPDGWSCHYVCSDCGHDWTTDWSR